MALDSLKEALQSRLKGFNHTVKFDFEEEGIVFVDASGGDVIVSEEDKDAEVTLRTTVETFEKILNGQQDPNIAFMMGKLKVSGSMGLALKLNSMLEE